LTAIAADTLGPSDADWLDSLLELLLAVSELLLCASAAGLLVVPERPVA
jgi:hypothetical protein